MIAFTGFLNAWMATMWQASWQGGLLVVVVWSLCHFWPSIPARFQSWLWRLVVLKFMLASLWSVPVEIPLLPAVQTASVEWATPAISTTSVPDTSVPVQDIAVLSVESIAALRQSSSVPSPWLIPLIVWAVVVGWQLVRIRRGCREAKLLRDNCRPITNQTLLNELANASKAFGLRMPPNLLETDGEGSPMLVGIVRPAIVVPTTTLGRLDHSEKMLVFGHELAHVRRADLFWNLMAALVRTVFFFHPLIWITERRLRLVQEIAADELTIHRRQDDPAHYGTLLVSIVSKLGPDAALPTMVVGTKGSQESLKQRLAAMRYMKPASVRATVSWVVLLAAVGVPGIVPWTLVAAEPPDENEATTRPGTPEITPAAKPFSDSREAAFRWLVSQQQDDGSWDLNRGTNPSSLSAPTAGTAFAVLPFLRAGQTPAKGAHSKSIAKGLAFIQSRMKFDDHGCHASAENGTMYGHAIITMTLCEALACTKDQELRVVAQGAVDFIVYAQDPEKGGWRYQPRTPGDTSVTGWQLQALAAASEAGLKVPERTIALANSFLDSTEVDGGVSYAYTPNGTASPTMSLVGLFCRTHNSGKDQEPQFMKGLENAAARGPTGVSGSNIYYDYYGTLLLKSAGGPKWKTWSEAVKSKLTQSQETHGDDVGSWFFADAWSQPLGRLGMTSFSLLILNQPAGD